MKRASETAMDLLLRCAAARAVKLDTVSLLVDRDNRADYHAVIPGVQGVITVAREGRLLVEVKIRDIEAALRSRGGGGHVPG